MTLRFNFPFAEAGRRASSDSPEVLETTFRAAIAVLGRDPTAAPAEDFDAVAGVARIALLEDHFEVDLGWAPLNLGATSGLWERGVPVDDPGWAYDPATAGHGSGKCWLQQNQRGRQKRN